MKKRYTEEQIIKAIRRHESGVKVDGLCKHLDISAGTCYNWQSKHTELELNEAKRLTGHELKKNKLKRMLADNLLEVEVVKDVLSKKW
jgi:putative transposase